MPESKGYYSVNGSGAVVTTAIHTGHAMRSTLAAYSKLTAAERLREEDPYTDLLASVCSSRIIATHSRFEVDLNRPRERAVYRSSADAWGLDLWQTDLPQEEIALSLALYERFYDTLDGMIREKLRSYRRVVVLDIHSYNHRRGGERAPFDDPVANPEIIIGTGTMPERSRWHQEIEAVHTQLREAVIAGRYLDVRENVKFSGGYMAQWLHSRYPESVCCISLEFKKIFMNEWSGRADTRILHEIKEVMAKTVNFLETI